MTQNKLVYPNIQHMENMANLLNIPSQYNAIALIAVGTAKEDTKIPDNRFNPAAIHLNQW